MNENNSIFPCAYWPHYHSDRDKEIECRHRFIISIPKEILMHPICGFEEWEINFLKGNKDEQD